MGPITSSTSGIQNGPDLGSVAQDGETATEANTGSTAGESSEPNMQSPNSSGRANAVPPVHPYIAKQIQSYLDGGKGARSSNGSSTSSSSDSKGNTNLPPLPDNPDNHEPPHGTAPAKAAPACPNNFATAGMKAGAVVGGAAACVIGGAPGAVRGATTGFEAGGEGGAAVGTLVGPEGTAAGATVGSLGGAVVGGLVGGAPGCAKAVAPGVVAGATLGAAAGHYLDQKFCPAPAAKTKTPPNVVFSEGTSSSSSASSATAKNENNNANDRFSSKDPLVTQVATEIESKIPGSVDQVNKEISFGTLKSDADIALKNGDIIEVKSGSGKGTTSQALDQQKILKGNGSTGEVIVYGPDLGKHVTMGMRNQGFKVFNNTDDLISYIKSKGSQ